jgi:hypothetical protein
LDEAEDARFDFQRIGKFVIRQAEGRFEDQRVCCEKADRLRGAAAAGLKISGVEQRRAVFDAGDMQHRRAGNMASRE